MNPFDKKLDLLLKKKLESRYYTPGQDDLDEMSSLLENMPPPKPKPKRFVLTRIASSASPFGFSLNSTIRPSASVFSKPKPSASSRREGITEIVTSAFVS